jgi:hypothetical protein
MIQEASMVAIGAIGAATLSGIGIGARREPTAVAYPPQRALVALTPAPAANPERSGPVSAKAQATAPFLSHLIATAQGAPQTRERRQVDPNRATTTYATMMQAPAVSGRVVSASR